MRLRLKSGSELLYVVKSCRVPECLPETLPVFDVAGVVADAGIENVVHGVLPKE